MSVVKKLFSYAALYKKLIIGALIMLSISVAADLTGPFVAKKIIDSHILGIESQWYETEESKDAVPYQGSWYKREEYFTDEESKGKEVRVLQVGTKFVFAEEAVPFDGTRELIGETLTVTRNGESEDFSVSIIGKRDLMGFYQPEISRIIMLVAFYFG